MLLTDQKDNLGELFEVGREVVSYKSSDEAIDRLKYYTEHADEAAAIAKAGQQRTLREHTYAERMKELVPLLRTWLGKRRC
jgi:spore maturation protein CgeB